MISNFENTLKLFDACIELKDWLNDSYKLTYECRLITFINN